MTKTNVIFFDGISGSGKSTTSQFIYLDLLREKFDVSWYYEHEHPHPIVSTAEIDGALKEKMPWQEVFGLILGRANEFVAQQAETQRVHLFESCYYQIIAGYLFRMNCSADEIREQMKRLEESLAPVNPSLIYFCQEDIAQALYAVCDKRGHDFDQYLLQRFVGTPYGETNSVTDLDSLIKAYIEFRDIADDLVASSSFETLSIDSINADWPGVMEQVSGFIGSDPYRGPPDPCRPVEDYAGQYREANSGHEWNLITKDGELFFEEFGTRLHPYKDDGFLIEGVTVELNFSVDERNRISQIVCAGNVIGDPIIGTVWNKVS